MFLNKFKNLPWQKTKPAPVFISFKSIFLCILPCRSLTFANTIRPLNCRPHTTITTIMPKHGLGDPQPPDTPVPHGGTECPSPKPALPIQHRHILILTVMPVCALGKPGIPSALKSCPSLKTALPQDLTHCTKTGFRVKSGRSAAESFPSAHPQQPVPACGHIRARSIQIDTALPSCGISCGCGLPPCLVLCCSTIYAAPCGKTES